MDNTVKYSTDNNFYKNENFHIQSSDMTANKTKHSLIDLKRLKISSSNKFGQKLKKVANTFDDAVAKDNFMACNKTHFKAASVLANNRNTNDSKTKPPKSNLENFLRVTKEEESLGKSQSLPKFKEKMLKYTSLKGDLLNLAIIKKLKQNENITEINSQDLQMKGEGFLHRFSHLEENLDVIKSNPLLYNIIINKKNDKEYEIKQSDYYELNYLKNLLENKKREELVQAEQRGLKFLKKLKVGKRKENALISENPKTFFNKYVSDELDFIKRGN
jgi:hypothetical protein